MNKRTLRWLMAEIALWEHEALVDANTAARLQKRYEGQLGSGRNLALTAFGILGALLVGAGVLLLLAHNWADLPRAVRTGLSLLPLVTAQVVALIGLAKGREGTGWREGLGLFWFLSIGGAIAMVGQIYQLPGSFDRFMLTWALLGLPVAWVMRSSVAAVFYLAAATAWTMSRYEHANQELWFWALLAGLFPLANRYAGARRFESAAALFWWAGAVAVCIGTAFTLTRAVPGLWIIVACAWSAIYLLVDQRFFRDAPSIWQRPFLLLGVFGALHLMLGLTFEEPWREIGWHHFHERGAVWRQALDPVLALGLSGVALVLLVSTRAQLKPSRFALGLLPVVSILAYALAASLGRTGSAMLIFNLYAFVAGLLLLADGFRLVKSADVNAGLLCLAALVLLRFFDSEQDILVRGVVFVALGAVFLVVNMVLARRKARSV